MTYMQAVLFGLPSEPTHVFYVATNWCLLKPGQTVDVHQRMKNAQFKGFDPIAKMPCPCELQPRGRFWLCERELWWQDHFEDERIKRSEQYRLSERTLRAVEYVLDPSPVARAALDRLWRNLSAA